MAKTIAARIHDNDTGTDELCIFNSFSDQIAAIGPGVGMFQRVVKFGDEGPWWPSYFPLGSPNNIQHVDPSGEFDIGENLVTGDDLNGPNNGSGLDTEAALAMPPHKIFYYYRHFEEECFGGIFDDDNDGEVEFPEWDYKSALKRGWIARKHPDDGVYPGEPAGGLGLPYGTNRSGIWLCVNSNYRNVTIDRVEDLAGFGGVGIHFDSEHNPKEGCFCNNCDTLWTSEGWPDSIYDQTAGEPEIVDFYSSSLVRYFEDVVAASRDVKDEFIIAVKGSGLARLDLRAMRTDVAHVADVIALEFNGGVDKYRFDLLGLPFYEPSYTTRFAGNWGICRDACYGRPPKIVVDNTSNDNEVETFAKAAAVVALGGVAGLNYPNNSGVNPEPPCEEQLITNPGRALRSHQLGDALSPTLGHTRPVHWIGIVFPESSLDMNLRTWDQTAGLDNGDKRIYREVFSPIWAAIEVCQEQGAPYGLISEKQLLEYHLGNETDYLHSFTQIICPVMPDDILLESKLAMEQFDSSSPSRRVFYLDGVEDCWDGYDGQTACDRDTLKADLWHDLTHPLGMDAWEPPVQFETLGMNAADDELQLFAFEKLQGHNPTGQQEDDTLILLTQRWDWAVELGNPTPPPLIVQGDYQIGIKLDTSVYPGFKVSQVDLVDGSLTPLPCLDLNPFDDYVVVDAPAIDHLGAILVDRNGDTALP